MNAQSGDSLSFLALFSHGTSFFIAHHEPGMNCGAAIEAQLKLRSPSTTRWP